MTAETTDGGRPVETTAADVLAVFDERADPAEPLTATEVADRSGCSRRTALNRLHDLEDDGAVASKKVGGRARVWWVPRAGASAPTDEADRVDSASDEPPEPADEPADHPGDVDDAEKPATDDTGDDLAGTVRAYLEENDHPPKTAHGRDAVVDVFRALREHGTMATTELKEQVYEGYTDKWSGARGMWNAIDRYLKDVPGIEKGGYGEWAYAGDDAVREALAAEDVDAGEIYDPTEEF